MFKVLVAVTCALIVSACAHVPSFCETAKPIPPAVFYNEASPGVFDHVKVITDAGCQAEPGCSSALTDIRTILGDSDGTTERLAAYNALGVRLGCWSAP